MFLYDSVLVAAKRNGRDGNYRGGRGEHLVMFVVGAKSTTSSTNMADTTFSPVDALARQQHSRRALTAHSSFMVGELEITDSSNNYVLDGKGGECSSSFSWTASEDAGAQCRTREPMRSSSTCSSRNNDTPCSARTHDVYVRGVVSSRDIHWLGLRLQPVLLLQLT
ncbi:hypothetical protein F2P81_005822 [Scophthalmus maximus]|uniref:Uncharacterized protein n=1 Tax=Scophthalmus maximus TaxID=52904 RepID=A0A6A4TEU6_SCOMX|nr:hypothetical protein F2P81_005822 [Scophthalmus maximus]